MTFNKSRNKNAQYVHAGIILDDEHVIEMAGPGIKLGKISEELGGKKVAVFRCRDKEVTELALDLAINMEKTLVEDAFPQMASRKTDKNFGPIKYDFLGAGRALCAKTRKEKQITQLHKELLDIATSMNIPHKMFCSQMVTHVYSMANLLLDKPQSMLLPLNSLPCMLYDYLTTNPNFEHHQVKLKKLDTTNAEIPNTYMT